MTLAIARIRAHNFRRFPALVLEAHPKTNVILGDNAEGKTTLLEALYCLGRARSFRTAQLQELGGTAEPKAWALTGTITQTDRPVQQHELKWQSGKLTVRVDERAVTLADLIRNMPVQILDPSSHRLLQEGPAYRRAFLDWGVFHVEHSFYNHWRRFQRALRQRNQALRNQSKTQVIQAWNPELALTANVLTELRHKHLQEIQPRFEALTAQFLDREQALVELRQGWELGKDYAEVLELSLEADRKTGTTLHGPHRAELQIRVRQRTAKSTLSRGQQKMLIAALQIAQSEWVAQKQAVPILLVDDFSSELSSRYRQVLLEQLLAYPGQTFITAFPDESALRGIQDARMFHVEQGKLNPLPC